MTAPTFRINRELLHLALELAVQTAQKAEIERQFAEQFPGHELDLRQSTADFPGWTSVDINVDGYTVVIE